MGSNLREILDNVCYPEIFLSFPNDKEKKKIGSKENAILEFYQQFACVGGDPVFSESLCKELQKKFFQQRCELGRIGRRNMNRRLNLDIPQNNTFLLPRDVLAAADHLIGIKFGMGTLDDMNHLKNKRIRSIADLLQDQFGLALVRLENAVRGTICGAIRHKLIPTPQNLVTSTSLTTTYESFFGLHPLSQVFDRTNPLTQIVHGRKLSYLGPGGLTGRTASFRIRDIHPSHYGRICPIDTSEGINVGLIGSLAIHVRIGHWGSIESPFYEISERSKEAQIVYLSPNRDEYYMVAAGNSLALNRGIQEEQVVPARYRQEFLTIAWEQIHLRSIFPFQYFSIGASLIPFIEHNDANRALMSSNMQRQAVPLSQSERCIVGTGLERQTALDSGVSAIAEHEGKIIDTDSSKFVFDRTNPLTQIVHGRKLSYLGPGGLTGRTASFRIRDIHPSHYGRICPIDTSEGINVGLIGSLAIHVRIGHWGSIESPFYEISERSKEAQIVYLSPNRDEYYMVAAGNSLALNRGIQEEQVVPARYRQEFLTIAWEQIHLRSIFPFQYFSIGASLIPFIEHNDANRALMSSNMQRQAVPLSQSERCIVGTGLERQTALDSGVSAIAEHEGKIIYTDPHKIILSSNGDTTISISIPLVIYQRSNKNTCMHQKPQVPRGKCIKKGQILADGAATVGGELALGKNVLVAYMPWEGYNSEDAVLISERLVYEDIYTSFHIRKYEIQTHVTSQGPERITKEIPHLEAHLLRNLDRNGVVMLGSWVETGDILVGKLTPQTANESSYAPEDRLLRAILGIQVSTAKETSLKLPIGGRGRVIDVRWIRKKGGSCYNSEMIRVYISQKREIKVGDKVAGRHGNKGIISKILPRQDMPYLQDGTPVDMVFNPLGVPSRMNVGQIFECSLGLAGDLLKRHYRIAPFDERYEQEASRKLVFSELYEASKQTKNPWVFEPEYPGKSRIFDGRTGNPFEQPVLIGKSYILKLIHQVDDKIHGRSSGHYALVTQQPLRGRAKQGGQRVGEMEVWALEGFGVAHILQEMLTYKSDHIRARQEVLGATIIGGRVSNPEDAPESFRLLVRELRSLALELNHFLLMIKSMDVLVDITHLLHNNPLEEGRSKGDNE
ncbi:hypothetical protein C4D60_Mb00t06930 [Musa balbisiana]|uniref:DNA-directed RNA polymerase subunit beta n=2 Tax=Musa balbisiana TaxID=52838 RepID=A0A4S8I6K2_MUSBA|nr:hypothetical protein C4D60_Mb00t06930 [Musa balbisiana]